MVSNFYPVMQSNTSAHDIEPFRVRPILIGNYLFTASGGTQGVAGFPLDSATFN